MDTTETTLKLTINGKQVELAPGTTIADFLASKGYHERLVVVEINGKIVPRTEYGTTTLSAGDEVEIVHFVGGG
ncbi:MAG TPA: sulfur carrier protein ThiS [Thermomicrobiales bacterium]